MRGLRFFSVIVLAIIAGCGGATGSDSAETPTQKASASPSFNASATVAVLVDDLASDDDWQPMLITYTGDGSTIRLTYQDRQNWRKEVFPSPLSDQPTSVMLFNGETYTEVSLDTMRADGGYYTMIETIAEGIVFPERWLHPGFVHGLIEQGYRAETSDQPDQLVLVATGTIGCQTAPPTTETDPEPPRMPTPWDRCDEQGTLSEVQRYLVRTDISPPIVVGVDITIEGEPLEHVEVEEIDLTPPALDLNVPTPAISDAHSLPTEPKIAKFVADERMYSDR